MYYYLYDNYSKEQIKYFTLFILLIADLPIIFFTFLDIYKFKCLNKYRINYNYYRKYPTKNQIICGVRHSLVSLFGIIMPITTFGILFSNYIGYFPYKMDREFLRLGDKATVHFKFKYRPEYIETGSKLIFREGKTKGIGKVINVY